MAEEARSALTRALAALVLAATVLTAAAAPPQKSKPAWAELTASMRPVSSEPSILAAR